MSGSVSRGPCWFSVSAHGLRRAWLKGTSVAGYERIEDVLRETQHMLQLAQIGLDDFLRGDRGARRTAGLFNVVVFGRSVTLVLQNIRHFQREAFNAWYAPYEQEMQGARYRYLVKLRDQMLKEGRQGAINRSMRADYLNPGHIQSAMGKPPPGATGWAMDAWGIGWTVPMADGSEERFYVDLPDDLQNEMNLKITAWFAEEAGGHHGAPVAPPPEPIDVLLTEYVDYLARLVDAAHLEFGPK